MSARPMQMAIELRGKGGKKKSKIRLAIADRLKAAKCKGKINKKGYGREANEEYQIHWTESSRYVGASLF